jgi:hypothetical protein
MIPMTSWVFVLGQRGEISRSMCFCSKILCYAVLGDVLVVSIGCYLTLINARKRSDGCGPAVCHKAFGCHRSNQANLSRIVVVTSHDWWMHRAG